MMFGLDKMRTAIAQAAYSELGKANLMLQNFAQANTHGASYRPNIRASVKSHRLYGGKNQTDKLYSQTGNLLRSMSKGGKGNIFKVEKENSSVGLKYGVDVSIIPYARVHELGGQHLRKRPYINPAVKEFFETEIDDTINNIFELARKEFE